MISPVAAAPQVTAAMKQAVRIAYLLGNTKGGNASGRARFPDFRMDTLIGTFSDRGDLAHLALFLWASAASALAWRLLRELAAAIRRFDDFVRELALFNERIRGRD